MTADLIAQIATYLRENAAFIEDTLAQHPEEAEKFAAHIAGLLRAEPSRSSPDPDLPCLLDCDCHFDPELDHGSCDYCTGKSEQERSRLGSSPDLTGLDAAWAEAEAALPEGWIGPSVDPYPDTPGTFYASAFSRRHWIGEEDALVDGEGTTPAAALRALAARLSPAPETDPSQVER